MSHADLLWKTLRGELRVETTFEGPITYKLRLEFFRLSSWTEYGRIDVVSVRTARYIGRVLCHRDARKLLASQCDCVTVSSS